MENQSSEMENKSAKLSNNTRDYREYNREKPLCVAAPHTGEAEELNM